MPSRSIRSSAPAGLHQTPTRPDDTPAAAPPLTRREAREREGRIRSAPRVTTAPPAAAARAVARESQAPTPQRPAGEAAFDSRRNRRAAERHRAHTEPFDRRGSSFVRPSRRTVALAVSGGLVVVAVASNLGLTVGAAPWARSAPAAPSASPSPTSVAVLPAITGSSRVVLSAVSTTSGTVAGGTSVTLEGSNLDAVATVRFGGAEGSVAVENPDQITVTAPPAAEEAEGVVPVAFFDAHGEPVRFDAVTDSAAAVTVDGAPADSVQPAVDRRAAEGSAAVSTDLAVPTQTPSEAATGVLASTKVVASAITFAYTPDPAIEAAKARAALDASRLASQLDYLGTYWSDYNSAQYGVIPGNDCVNFTSQSLIARGWNMDGEWNYSSTSGYSSAWASSTAFNSYLAAHPERATPIANTERSRVKPGDIVQFDWDGSGDWDHTGVVTRVVGGTILYSSHTMNNHDQSVDAASARRIMFWGV